MHSKWLKITYVKVHDEKKTVLNIVSPSIDEKKEGRIDSETQDDFQEKREEMNSSQANITKKGDEKQENNYHVKVNETEKTESKTESDREKENKDGAIEVQTHGDANGCSENNLIKDYETQEVGTEENKLNKEQEDCENTRAQNQEALTNNCYQQHFNQYSEQENLNSRN